MANIAVICEGVSEFNILNHIVSRYAGEHFLNAIQPRINYNKQTQSDDGGWSRVLDHCTNEVIEDIFKLNDYLIIQIDTDSSHISPFDIVHNFKDGTEKSHERLHAEIKARLVRDLSNEIRKRYLHRIFFAICHNEIECWLLPIYYTDKRACKTHNCIKVLNLELSRRNMAGIPDTNKNSSQARKAYNAIFKSMKKRAIIEQMATNSYGFKCFLLGLDSMSS
ncbi:MAG: hypothetical protein HDS35_08420 [Bacteroides sp.]|nr:hypothetical protein [Bacteroides sp.]